MWIYVCSGSRALVTKPCQTLVSLWTAAYQAPLSMGFPRQEYQSGLPFPSPGYLPNPGIKPSLLHCRWILYQLSHQGSPCMCVCVCVFKTPFLLLYLWFWKSYPFFKICLIHYLLQFLPIKHPSVRCLVWAGKPQLGNAAWGASFPSERALPAGGFGSVHTPSP